MTAMDNRQLVRICLFAALIAALGLLPRIDLPVAAGVPVTAQTFGVMMAGLVLGARAGALAVLLFLFVVALGMPFLAGGRGGLGAFAGPTAGFLIGWIPGAFVTGLIGPKPCPGGRPRSVSFLQAFAAALIGGVAVVYACGIPALSLIAGLNFRSAALASLVFLPGDILKAILAALITTYIGGTFSHGSETAP